MKFATTYMMAAALFLSMGFSSAARIQPVLFGASEHSQLPTSMVNGMQPNASTNYIVKPGETLSGLAKAYNTTAAALEQNNPSLKNNQDHVYVGERLNIPNANEGPTVVVAPTSGVPGTQIEVVLGGFPANTNVQLALDQITCSQRNVVTMKTDQNGQLTTQMTIPILQPSSQDYKRLGEWDVIAIAQSTSASSAMGGASSSSGSTMNSNANAASQNSSSNSNATGSNSNNSSMNNSSNSTAASQNSASSSNTMNSSSGGSQTSASSNSMNSSAGLIVVSSNVFDGSATIQPPTSSTPSSSQ